MPSRAPAPPVEFLPLQRIRWRGPTTPGFASSRFRCGFRVRALLPPYVPRDLSGRFRPATLLGFSPSKPFPPHGAVAPLGARCPPAVPRQPCAVRKPREAERTRLQGLAPRRSPSTAGRGLAARPLAAPLGFFRSKAFRRRVASRFRAAPLTGFPGPPLARRPAGLPGSRSACRCCAPVNPIRRSSVPGAATLLRFSHLVSASALFERRRSGLTPMDPTASLRFAIHPRDRPSALPEGARREFRCQARAVIRPSKA